MLFVCEKEKARKSARELIGEFVIENKNDFERVKKKSTNYSFFKVEAQSLINDFGGYIFEISQNPKVLML